MALKRHFHEQEGSGFQVPEQESKRRHTFATSVRDVMKVLSLDEVVSKLEPFLRKVVREEVERGVRLFLQPSPRSVLNQIDSSEERGWQLHFDNKLPSTIFTGSRIEAEDNTPVKIVLLDASSKRIIEDGPLSSLKIEVLVLDGDFGTAELEDWTEKEFNDHVVREREGKRPLVTGDRFITLRNGVGNIGDISFTDNSSWIRSRRFRLGARKVQSTSNEVRIREARSEAFVVKDHRGELYKKHYPPLLYDEVWRLERIAKDGTFHKRLVSEGIKTVKDFLRLYVTNQSSLRSILQCGTSNRTWEAIIEHATTCDVDADEWYVYHGAGSVRLLLNSIYKALGVSYDGQNYQFHSELTTSEKRFVEDLQQLAYKNLNALVPYDGSSVVGPSRPLLSPQADPLGCPNLVLQHLDFPIMHQETQLDFNNTETSLSYNYGVENNSQLEVSLSQPMQVFTPTLRNSFVMRDISSLPYSGGSGWAPGGSLGAMSIGPLAADEISPVQMSSFYPVPTTLGQRNSLFFPSTNEPDIGIFSHLPPNFAFQLPRSGRPKAGWCKIRAAVKWGILGKRDVAARRMAGYQLSGVWLPKEW
ncbi:hypothetical protein L1049_020845 [Liquidambar formosana]|uniref:Calmodulin-binding protein n=1 Tax=Liquidambar formosana TaxID=63359 RepID=A0AAP0SEI7_LIQFO